MPVLGNLYHLPEERSCTCSRSPPSTGNDLLHVRRIDDKPGLHQLPLFVENSHAIRGQDPQQCSAAFQICQPLSSGHLDQSPADRIIATNRALLQCSKFRPAPTVNEYDRSVPALGECIDRPEEIVGSSSFKRAGEKRAEYIRIEYFPPPHPPDKEFCRRRKDLDLRGFIDRYCKSTLSASVYDRKKLSLSQLLHAVDAGMVTYSQGTDDLHLYIGNEKLVGAVDESICQRIIEKRGRDNLRRRKRDQFMVAVTKHGTELRLRPPVDNKSGGCRLPLITLVGKPFQKLDKLLDRPETFTVVTAKRTGNSYIHDRRKQCRTEMRCIPLQAESGIKTAESGNEFAAEIHLGRGEPDGFTLCTEDVWGSLYRDDFSYSGTGTLANGVFRNKANLCSAKKRAYISPDCIKNRDRHKAPEKLLDNQGINLYGTLLEIKSSLKCCKVRVWMRQIFSPLPASIESYEYRSVKSQVFHESVGVCRNSAAFICIGISIVKACIPDH